jgi:hypothetical protein
MDNSAYAKLTGTLLGVWFLLSFSLSALRVFMNATNSVGFAVAIGASAPILLFFLWYAVSSQFRQFTNSLSPGALTYLQSWRIAGLLFVTLQIYGILPALFALPAGYGDLFIGATAPLVALKLANPNRRGIFILWQLLGIVDLVAAVGLGVTVRFIHPQGPSMLAMTVLPLSLIPTFLVPLFLIFHVISIANSRCPHEPEFLRVRTSGSAQLPA